MKPLLVPMVIKKNRKIPLVFRLDDPSPQSDHTLERSILDIVRARGVRITIGVVPFHSTPGGLVGVRAGEQLAHIEAAAADGLVEVALHGCRHAATTQAKPRGPSEFYGLPQAEQRELIELGLTRLREVFSVPIVGFIPPWNTFDASTINVAAQLGLEYVSAGWSIPANCPSRPVLIPRTCYLGRLRGAVERARLYRRVSPAIVAIFHPYDFFESGEPEARISLTEFDALLEWVTEQDDLEVMDLRTLSQQLDATSLLAMYRQTEWATTFHYRLGRRWPTEFIHTASAASMLASVVTEELRALIGFLF